MVHLRFYGLLFVVAVFATPSFSQTNDSPFQSMLSLKAGFSFDEDDPDYLKHGASADISYQLTYKGIGLVASAMVGAHGQQDRLWQALDIPDSVDMAALTYRAFAMGLTGTIFDQSRLEVGLRAMAGIASVTVNTKDEIDNAKITNALHQNMGLIMLFGLDVRYRMRPGLYVSLSVEPQTGQVRVGNTDLDLGFTHVKLGLNRYF